MKNFLPKIILLLYLSNAFADNSGVQNKSSDIEKSITSGVTTDNIIKIAVNGLVCDFCAQAIEKVFMKKKEVEGIDVNLEAQVVVLFLKEKTNINNQLISDILEDAGYNIENIDRKI